MGKWATYRNRGGSGGPGVIESYLARVAAAGGTMDATGTAAVTQLYNRLARTGVWDRLGEVWPCVGTNLAAVMVKLKVWPSTAASYLNQNFVLGDYNQTGGSGGLLGDGVIKVLTGGPPMNEIGLLGCLFADIRAASGGAGTRVTLGAANGADFSWLMSNPPATNTIGRLGQSFNATFVAAASAGRWTVNRQSPTLLELWQDEFRVATNASAATATTAIDQCAIFASNTSGSPVSFSSARLGGAAFGRVLSATQIAELVGAWTEFDASLSR